MIKAYAESGSTANTNSTRGEQIIRDNMKKNGKSGRQINAAVKRSKNLNGKVTRL